MVVFFISLLMGNWFVFQLVLYLQYTYKIWLVNINMNIFLFIESQYCKRALNSEITLRLADAFVPRMNPQSPTYLRLLFSAYAIRSSRDRLIYCLASGFHWSPVSLIFQANCEENHRATAA